MTDNIFNQTGDVDEKDVEFYFKETRNWDNPPSKDKIREDLKDPLKHINYMYPTRFTFEETGNE